MNTEDIIKANVPLIKKIATKFYNVSFEDLFQAGCMGVLKAYKNYRRNGTTKFSTYAYDYIYGEMYDCVYKSHKLKVSKDMLRLARQIEIVKNTLSQKLNRLATYEEIAKFLDLDVSLIYEAINSNNEMISLDSDVYEDKDYYEKIASQENVSIEEKIDLKQGISTLNPEEQKIINYRYFKDMTQSEIAKKLNMTQVMVSRYEQKSLKKLRQFYEVA